MALNPLNSSNLEQLALKGLNSYTLLYGPSLPFFISDIRVLWYESARMSEIKNCIVRLYGAFTCNHA